jgi:hypothetical protein
MNLIPRFLILLLFFQVLGPIFYFSGCGGKDDFYPPWVNLPPDEEEEESEEEGGGHTHGLTANQTDEDPIIFVFNRKYGELELEESNHLTTFSNCRLEEFKSEQEHINQRQKITFEFICDQNETKEDKHNGKF